MNLNRNNENNAIILPKTTNQNLLAQYYSMADVFVICSRRENFPTTCLEAQCCGTPVVGFDAGGTKETTVLDESDFVEYGDIEGLAELIRHKMENKPEGLYEKAKSAYSKESMIRQYLYQYDIGGRKNKVLLVDVNCNYSSTGKIAHDLYSGAIKDGRSAAICYGRGPKTNENAIYKFGLDWETYLHAGLARITGYNGYFSALSTRRLIRFIQEYEPDLIHLHELHAYFVNIKPLIEFIKSKQIPLIWTFHCEYMYTGKCGHAYECTNFQKECGNCPAVREYPKSLLLDKTKQMLKMKKQLLRDLDFSIITPSRWLEDRVKLSFLKDKKISVIHNGIDTSVFHPVDYLALKRDLQIPYDAKVVLALAPNIMSDQKGGKVVLELSNIMRNDKVFFVLVGN